jgi:hypothetical protein
MNPPMYFFLRDGRRGVSLSPRANPSGSVVYRQPERLSSIHIENREARYAICLRPQERPKNVAVKCSTRIP